MLGGWWVQPGLLKHTAILKSYSNFIPVNAIWEMYCLCPPSVRLLRVCLLQLESIFHTSECKRRNAGGRDGKKCTQTKKKRNIQQIPPLDRRPIQCIYNMTGSSESLLLCLARAPQGRPSLSFLLLFISSRLRAGSEERGRTTGGNGSESLKKGEAHCKQNM